MRTASTQAGFEGDVIAAYQRGVAIREIKRHYHIGYQRLYRLLEAHRVPLRSDYMDEADIVRAYLDGERLLDIQRRHHVRRDTIHAVLARHGIARRAPLSRVPRRAGYCVRCGIALAPTEREICQACLRALRAGRRHARGELSARRIRELGVVH